jgi:integrase
MATISKYQTASGATLYRVRYRTPDHRQTDKRGFATKRAAEAFAASVEVSKLKGEYVAPSHARTTLGELGSAWLDRQRGHLKPSSYRATEIEWRVRVAPRWGKVALGDIRPTAIQQWVSDLSHGTDGAKPVGASVVNRAHHVLSSILADAVRDNLLARNPASGIRLPRKNRKRPVYLTHQQVAELAAASGTYEGLVLLLAYTGLRWGEAIGLRVRDLATPTGHHRRERRPGGLGDLRGNPEGPQAAQRAAARVSAALPCPPVRTPGPRRSAVPRRRWQAPRTTALHERVVHQGRRRIGRAACDAPRPAAQRGQPGGVGGCQRQGGPEDARPRQRGHDSGRVRRPVR